MSETQDIPQTPYEILGDQGIKDLASAFYDAMDELPLAADIRAMHAENLDHIKRMLAAYLTQWMGGPPVYQAIKGTVCLTDPHEPFRIGPKERDQWLACMDEALIRIDASDELKEMLGSAGVAFNDETIYAAIQSVDTNGNAVMEWGEFVSFWTALHSN